MKRLAGLALALLVIGAPIAPTGADATAPTTASPTLAGPTLVTYLSHVTLTGTTPEPGEAVVISFKASGTSSYVPRRNLVSDDSGHYRTTFYATSTQYIAARAGGVNSYVLTVRVPRADCATSGPAFAQLPTVPGRSPSHDDFAIFTATRGYTWAGAVFHAPSIIDLVTWHGSTPHVLARYDYFNGTPFEPVGSVKPVGFSPGFAVIAAVFDPAVHGEGRGYYWYAGVRHVMSHGPWRAWAPTAVSDSGAVIGWASTGTTAHEHYYVIEWPSAGGAYRVLADTGIAYPEPTIDGAGDVLWSGQDSMTALLHSASGVKHQLWSGGRWGDPWGNNGFGVVSPQSSANAVYAPTQYGDYRWIVDESAPALPIYGHLISEEADAAVSSVSHRNDAIVGYAHPHLRTASGAYTTMPAQLFREDANAINMNGTVAFTAPADHRIHFLRCTTS